MSVSFLQQHRPECKNIPVRAAERSGVAWARGLWPLQWIEIGRDWFMLTPGEQEAVLLHEVGHCRGHHMIARWLLLPLCWLPAVQALARRQELAADAFAVREGRGLDLLRFIFRFNRVPDDPIARKLCPPPQERAQNILRLLSEMRHEQLAA